MMALALNRVTSPLMGSKAACCTQVT